MSFESSSIPASSVMDVPDAPITSLQLRCATNDVFDSPKQYVFEQRHGIGLIFVSNVKDGTFNEETQENSIQILNTFGASTPKLSVNFKMPKVGPLLDAIVGHCHGNLIALKINDITGNGNRSKDESQLIRPFMENLGKHFPNLKYLTIDYRNDSTICPYWEKMVYEIPSLTHLELNGRFEMGTLKQFLELNPQIESLSVSGDRRKCRCSDDYNAQAILTYEKLPSDLFKWLDKMLPNLKHLYINVNLVKNSPALKRDSNVYLKQLQTFVCEQYEDNYWQPNMELLAGDALEHLEINHHFDGKLVDFVAEKLVRFVNLKQLTINAFPKFKYYLSAIWSANGLRDFILSKPQLTKIVIRKRSEEFNGHYFASDDQNDAWLKPYREVADVVLNGFKWTVRGGSFTIELIKVNPK